MKKKGNKCEWLWIVGYIADDSRIYNGNLLENLEAYNSIIDGCTGGDYIKIKNSNVRNQILKGLYSIKNKEIY